MKNTASAYAMMLTDNGPDAELLDAWLSERIDSQTEGGTSDALPAGSADGTGLGDACLPYDETVCPGQVRILSKRFVADPQKVPYVAVIEQWEDNVWLVAPFSRYAYPATPGEMTTRIGNCGLHVLQVWNARTVRTRLLEKSFLFGELDEHVRQNAADLFRHEMSGKALPASFDALTGPAMTFEADPRQDYLEESVAQLRPLSTAVKATDRVLAEIYGSMPEETKAESGTEEAPVVPAEDPMASKVVLVDFSQVRARQSENTVVLPFFGEAEYANALAAGNEVDVTQTFQVCKDELSLEYSPEEKMARLTFYDSEDRPNAAYDGYGIFGTGFEFLGVFKDGMATVPAESVKNWFQLVDPEGNAVALAEKPQGNMR